VDAAHFDVVSGQGRTAIHASGASCNATSGGLNKLSAVHDVILFVLKTNA
jgi:hypothetical protein